jgi:hypothetical protein
VGQGKLRVDKGCKEKVELLGSAKKTYFTKLRPTFVEERVDIKEVRKKNRGKFESLAYWRA